MTQESSLISAAHTRAAELNELLATCDCLVDAETMQGVYNNLATQITLKLKERLPVVLAVMNGGLIPAGALLSRLNFPLEIGYVHATRYRGQTQGGALQWLALPQIPLAEREVLIIDDVFDEGVTLKSIAASCSDAGATRVWVAVATNKVHDHKVSDFLPDFVGIDVPDRFILGEGLDYNGFFRNVQGIYALPQEN
ncbi:hypoxanthine-guanine phosphoribosyltransferase [Halothiobacillus sp.]|uniref:hypoxanthine-guanine phosphoribosyltransferase n=1 Tax=Halothiobacillus sp. TaxID=1891311 RepID=UPI002632A351|nr:hypoxanthine-guanine phosphoribosyltransferase [Halothiobacillus sp.]